MHVHSNLYRIPIYQNLLKFNQWQKNQYFALNFNDQIHTLYYYPTTTIPNVVTPACETDMKGQYICMNRRH
jgi:hypothetical protein